MTADALPTPVQGALEAVRGFLSNLLKHDVHLAAELSEASGDPATGSLVLVGSSGAGEALFAVTLDEGWMPVLSESVPDEARGTTEGPALMQDVAAQAYRAFHAHAAAMGFAPPEVTFAVTDSVPALSEPLGAVAFTWSREGEALAGGVLLPSHVLSAAPASVAKPAPAAPEAPIGVARAAFEDFGSEHVISGDGGNGNLDVLSDVELEVTVELGRRRLPLADVLRLTTGSIIELEKLVGQPLEIYANGRLIAEGEAVVIDEQFGVRVTGLASRSSQRQTHV